MVKRRLITGMVMAFAILLAFSACSLGVAEPILITPIKEPYISIQPQSYSYFTDADSIVTKLTTEVWDWDEEDGTLSFQWYSFGSIEAYCANNGNGTAINGETGTELTLPAMDKQAGKQYFYYVEVTNVNPDATDSTIARRQSELSIISFSEPGTPLIPIIKKQPVGSTFQFGRSVSLAPLEVTALLPAGSGAASYLSYQWYRTTKFTVNTEAEGVELIPGANQASYIPDPESITVGTVYYFVVVTNTLAANSVVQVSLPVALVVEPGIRAAAPRIETQPKNSLYFTGETIQPLSVKAQSLDFGQLSYQWYTNTNPYATGGTVIPGAIADVYLPPAPSSGTGTNFYYVVVTNTNANVAQEKTALTASSAVRVSVAASGTMAENASFNIVPGTKFQYVRGYGGMNVAWANFPEEKPADTELMYNPDWGLGYNIMRIMIMPWDTNVDVMMRDLTASHRPDYYENVKIVNKYGGYVKAAPWSPPKEWKSNNSVNGGGGLLHQYRRQYANYLRSFAKHMYDRGAPIYAVSIQNEPNYAAGYDGCEWTGVEMRDFWIEVGRFTNGIRGFGGGREIPSVLTVNGESANSPFEPNLPTLQSPVARQSVDILARHVYGSQTQSLWEQYRDLLDKDDGSVYEVWMTEHNINSANATAYPNDSTWNYVWRFMNDVDLVIRLNSENAFVWWASKRFYSMIGDGQFGTADGAALPRGYGLSHYAKFSNDTMRVGVSLTPGAGSTTGNGTNIPHLDRGTSLVNSTAFSLDNLTPKIVAFESMDGNEISMVMFTPTNTSGSGGTDMGTIKLNLPANFKIGSAYAVRSRGAGAAQVFQQEDVLVSAERNAAWVELPAGQILSVKFIKQ